MCFSKIPLFLCDSVNFMKTESNLTRQICKAEDVDWKEYINFQDSLLSSLTLSFSRPCANPHGRRDIMLHPYSHQNIYPLTFQVWVHISGLKTRQLNTKMPFL